MDPHAAWLPSRGHGTYLHAAADGLPVSLRRSTESLVAEWDAHVADYLAATASPAPRGRDEPEVETDGIGEGVLIRHGAVSNKGFSVFDRDWVVRVEAAGGSVHGRGEEVLRRSAASNFTEQRVGNVESFPDVTAHGDENEEGALRRRAVSLSVPSVEHGDELSLSASYGRYLAEMGARDYGEAEVEAVSTACGEESESFLLHHVGRSCHQGGAGDEAPEYLLRHPGGVGNHGRVEGRLCVEASASSERDGGNMRAPLDIFLVRERTEGVAPSSLDTVRVLGIGYWINTVKEWIFTRLGFGSAMPTIPRAWSWTSLMSAPVHQTGGHDGRGDGSCVICSAVMCIHAQHRLAFERLHGAGTFPIELAEIDYLKCASQTAGVWSPVTGSYPADMLDFIKQEFPGGLRCRDVPGWRACSLPFKAHATFQRKELVPIAVMFMLRYWGPMIGTVYAGRVYSHGNYNPNYIYRGDSASDTADHAVLCVAYRVTKKCELLIHVLDNQRPHGPLRWISYRAFMEFTCIQVEALSMDDLRIQSRSVPQRMMSWVIPRI